MTLKPQNSDFISQKHKFISRNSEAKNEIARKKGHNFSELWDIGMNSQISEIISESQKS